MINVQQARETGDKSYEQKQGQMINPTETKLHRYCPSEYRELEIPKHWSLEVSLLRSICISLIHFAHGYLPKFNMNSLRSTRNISGRSFQIHFSP